ncbi:MAG: cell division protein FtsZ [Bdellovibrio sp.]|nr:MAG: cell division protein FtsZ [Bdellovibrio sp.]
MEENITNPENVKESQQLITQEQPSPQPVIEQSQQSFQEETQPQQLEKKEEEAIADDVVSDDDEILKFIEESEPKIYVVGAGGSGCNTLNRLFELSVDGVTTIAANTDARHLLHIKANRKILLGKKLTKGRGCGSFPECGEKAAEEAADDIKKSLADASMVFVTCGLGGGSGTGAAPVIAKMAKRDMNALTVGVVTLPFSSEGRMRYENAMKGLENLKRSVDTLIVIKNDKLLNLAPDLPLNTAFKICDEVLAGSVKSIVELVTQSGMVNVDFADLNTVLKEAGYAVIGVGEATVDVPREDRARIAIETALQSPLLDADITNAKKVLVNVVGGEDLSLKEVEYIVAEAAKRVAPDAHIIFGSRIDPAMKSAALKVLVVLAGVQFEDFGESGDADYSDLKIDMV